MITQSNTNQRFWTAARMTICLIFCFIIFREKIYAIYDPLSVPNNKYGIHILETTELEKAAEIVNHNGDWGYVTIPIRANDRDLTKWTRFMVETRRLHIIPILRIASFPVDPPGGEASWMAPNEYDLVDFANFLDELPWPTKNRYVIIYNEPNHESEWGGFVYPQEYARVLDRAVDIFHKRNSDFFVIAAGMDASSDAYDYELAMDNAWPGIFDRVDGLSFHAYGNPAFSAYPNIYSHVNVASYRYEYSYSLQKPLFITEAGWINPWQKYYYQAFQNIWTDDNLVAITPFVLSAPAGPFKDFTLENAPGEQIIRDLTKISGQPQLDQNSASNSVIMNPVWTGKAPQTSKYDLIGSLKAVFFRIFQFPR